MNPPLPPGAVFKDAEALPFELPCGSHKVLVVVPNVAASREDMLTLVARLRGMADTFEQGVRRIYPDAKAPPSVCPCPACTARRKAAN